MIDATRREGGLDMYFDKNWNMYRSQYLPDNLSPEEKKEKRKLFFMGAACCFSRVMDIVHAGNKTLGEQTLALEYMQDELVDFLLECQPLLSRKGRKSQEPNR